MNHAASTRDWLRRNLFADWTSSIATPVPASTPRITPNERPKLNMDVTPCPGIAPTSSTMASSRRPVALARPAAPTAVAGRAAVAAAVSSARTASAWRPVLLCAAEKRVARMAAEASAGPVGAVNPARAVAACPSADHAARPALVVRRARRMAPVSARRRRRSSTAGWGCAWSATRIPIVAMAAASRSISAGMTWAIPVTAGRGWSTAAKGTAQRAARGRTAW